MGTLINHSEFESFIQHHNKGKLENKKTAITYTRVSSKEQTENNSLQLQRRECLALAKKKELTVQENFGGTFESAKTDERKEFQRMITYAKKHQISYIIVYSLDRFSRSGDNAIWLSRQLKEVGINILSVTQPFDAETDSGSMMQKIMFLFAQHDNDQRRTKTVGGMQERLRKGEWCTKAPVGYLNATIGTEKLVIPDPIYFPLIQKAFEWKVNENVTDVVIAERLIAAGWKKIMTKRNVHVILKNPFYCGIIISTIIPGEIINGIHEAAVSKDLFLRVNGIKKEFHHGYNWNTTNESLPLRAFVRCDVCGTGWAGYVVKAKNKSYYKCNKKGCRCNKKAEVMHEHFKEVLDLFKSEPEQMEIIKLKISDKLIEVAKGNIEKSEIFKRQITGVQKKLDKVTERFALEEITEKIYDQFVPQYKEEIQKAEKNLESTQVDLSNLKMRIDKYAEVAVNIGVAWSNATYQEKVNLQGFVFPEGIRYDHKNATYRTTRVNSVFAYIALLTGSLEKKKTRFSIDCIEKSGLVAGTGLEPMTFGL